MSRRTQNMNDVDEIPKKRRRKAIVSSSEESEPECGMENDEDEEMVDDAFDSSNNSSNKENESYDLDDNDEMIQLKCGRIVKIHLKNFMCHSNLLMEFNEKINLLVGNNGSGKSAIITALAIGLGADARTTNRGKNTKGLIKNGESFCVIEIHLSNKGLAAYEPETYGDTIIVFRKILASGSGEYKLKSESGQVISSKKDDLKRILLHMNIQPNNPIVILNQDNARAFLKDSDGKQLFKLFMQATQLQTILDKLNDCHQIFLKAKSQFEMHNRGLAIQKKELDGKMAQLEELKGVVKLQDRVKQLRCERGWIDVSEQESVKRGKEKQLRQISNKIHELLSIIQNKDNLDQQINAKISQYTSEISSKQKTLGEISGEINTIRRKIDEQTSVIIEQKSIVKRVEVRKQRLLEDIRTLEASLQERSNTDSVQALRQKNAQALAKLLEEEEEVKGLIESANRDVELLRQTLIKYEEKQESAKEKRHIINQKISRLEHQYGRYNTNQSDPLSAYDTQMPAFVRRVEQEFQRGGFSKAPRGPLGCYITVPDKKWRMAVEHVLGGQLTAFCVNNAQDRVKLDQIRAREFPNLRSFPIVTQKFVENVYNVQEHRTTTGSNDAPILMDVVTIEDPVVMNCLIDQIGIENVVLCTNDQIASSLTRNRQTVPHNLRRVICIAPYSEYFPAPNYRSYSLHEKPCRFIQVDTQEVRKQLKHAMEMEKQTLGPVEQELQVIRQQLQNTTDANRARTEELRKHERRLNDIRTNIQDIKNFEYPKEDEGEVLQLELEESRVALAEIDPTYNSENNKLKQHEETLKGYDNTMEILKRKRQKVEDDIGSIQRQSEAESNRLYTLATDVNRAKASHASLAEDSKTTQAEYNVINDKLKKLIDEASKYGPRCTPEFDRNSYNRKIAELEARIAQSGNAPMSIPEMETFVQTMEAEYVKSVALSETFAKTLKLLTDSRMLRYKYLKDLKAYFAFRVRTKFSSVLKMRNMQGSITFNYSGCSLELNIAPRGDKERTNTKALSGGERSYSTIAFLIALWSCCDSPFYFLDEYDVFTDQVNRFVMTKLLIHEALEKKDQFAFLTPQDMSSIKADKDITIHRFADPVRGDMSRPGTSQQSED